MPNRLNGCRIARWWRSPLQTCITRSTSPNGTTFPRALTNYREMLKIDEIDVISIALPNDLHAEVTIAAAVAGKHVICEKPLATTLEEADAMIAACAEAGVQLMYAEELCFAPKYVRARELATSGALGEIFLVKQSEEHSGPHSPWFWDVDRSGGGVLMDMGCHGIAFARWMLNNAAITHVTRRSGYLRPRRQDAGRGSRGHRAQLRWRPDGGRRKFLGQGRGHGRPGRDLWHQGAYASRPDSRQLARHLFRRRLRIRGRKSREYDGMDVHCLRGDLELRLPAGDAILRRLRAKRRAEFHDRRADGLAVLEAIYAAYRSAGTGATVRLPLPSPKGNQTTDRSLDWSRSVCDS